METERHPKGLYVLFLTEMWERFGFYSMLAMFTLYLKDGKQGFSWTGEEATRLYANYLMFVFAIHSMTAVYAALVCLVVGNGFFKPNVSAMVGHLYPEGSALKDRAYNIFYMGINIGALLAQLVAEVL